MKIAACLKSYRVKKAEIEATMERISVYQKALYSDNVHLLGYFTRQLPDPGMPKAPINQKSQVEKEVFSVETEKELTRELVEEWIQEERSKIFIKEMEINQIDAALKALTKQEKFIVESKYMDGLSWADIEISFQSTFKEPLINDSLRKRNGQALEKLTLILNPFYEKFTKNDEPVRKRKRKQKFPVSVFKLNILDATKP